MKRFLQIIALLAAFMVVSGTAWSQNVTDSVSVAPNGKGDVLIYPLYFAFDGGFQTKLQVINTSNTWSGVAKVVVRSPLYSQEMVDFYIFLSPNDMWEGILRWVNNDVIIYSEDDSSLVAVNPSVTFATAAAPMTRLLAEPSKAGCVDVKIYGYAEVFLAYLVNLPKGVDGTVDKEDIYDAFVGNGSIANPSPSIGLTPSSALAQDINVNILAGNMQIQAPLIGWTSAYDAVVLANYGLVDSQGLQETALGFLSDASMIEIEAAMAKNDLAMPYLNDGANFTFHFFTFPTKLSFIDSSVTNTCEYDARGIYDFKRQVLVNPYDMEEKTKTTGEIFSPAPEDINHLPFEVNFFVPSSFAQGWYRYGFGNASTARDNITYTGAPVIPLIMYFGADGFATHAGSWTEGVVTRGVVGVTQVD